MWSCDRKAITVSAVLLCGVSLLLVIIIICVRQSWEPSADPKVTVQQGTLRGFHSITRKGRKIVSFLGLPYAAPPTGELRFKAPQPPKPWLGTRDATEDGPMCLQPSASSVLGEEDCLYLNVHTPKLPDESSPLLPVMVWIHGGGFFSGTGNSKLVKPTYLLDHNVVLVTLNYRLGPLGFLSAGDEVLPGNYGLKDQVAALVWVRENIKEFGGNSNCVTIFGGSAGGTSVHYHMLSPISQGLFHRAISQSGTALGPFAFASTEIALANTMKVASLLHCHAVNTTELVTCLRTKNATDIIEKLSEFQMWGGIPTVEFTAVAEHSGSTRFLPDTPVNILKAKKSAGVPWLAGVNAQDGCIIAEPILVDPTKVIQLDKYFSSIALETMYFRRQENASSVAEIIRNFYFGDNHIDSEAVSEVTNMYTDSYFLYPLNWSVTLEAAAGNKQVYMYYFTYIGTASNSVLYGDTQHAYGACHGDELLYLFPHDAVLPNFTQNEQDQRMIDILTTLWTNFARTGKPTDQVSKLVPVAWDTVTQQAGNYLEIGVHLYRRNNLLPLPVRLWCNVFQWAYNTS